MYTCSAPTTTTTGFLFVPEMRVPTQAKGHDMKLQNATESNYQCLHGK